MFKLLLLCMCLGYPFSWAQQENGSILELIKKLAAKIDRVEENTKTLNAKLTKVETRLEKNEKSFANLNNKVEEVFQHQKKREFKFVETPQTWMQAEETCRKWGGHLLTIVSKDEQDYFVKEINKRHWTPWTASWGQSITGVWIGLNAQKEKGKFVWVGNENSFYFNWGGTQPDGDGNCAHMWMDSGIWNDIPCGDWKFHSICERYR